MRIIGLVENTTCDDRYRTKHGLSIYIETSNHKLLVDVGPDDTIVSNAKNLGIALEDVDTVILSHGHRDHGGGLKAFFEVNNKARVYIQESAFEDYRISILGVIKKTIAIDKALKTHPQVELITGNVKIDEEIQVITNPRLQMLQPEGNKVLYRKANGGYEKDSFNHEQSLILQVEGISLLIAACAHRGITNIINEAELILKQQLDYVISGFHLMNPVSLTQAPSRYTSEIAQVMKTKETRYYTCHCTGEKAYKIMKDILGDQLDYLHAGTVIEL